MTIPLVYLTTEVTVAPYAGIWGQFGPDRALRCLLDEHISTSQTQAGVVTYQTATLYALPDEQCPAGSRITLPDGRVGYAAAVVHHVAPGLPTPDHTEIAVDVGAVVPPAFGEQVILMTRTPVAGRDAYGNTRYATTETPVDGCAIRALSSSEAAGDTPADRIADEIEVIMPPGTAVTAHDRIRARGLVYEVNGTPNGQYNPMTGTEPGVRVVAQRISGR